MAQSLVTYAANESVQRGAMLDMVPPEDWGDEFSADHPSAYDRLTGGSQRRCGKRLPGCPTREDPSAYDIVNGVEDDMIAHLDGDIAAKENAELDEDIVWNPSGVDLTEQAKAERMGAVEVKMTANDAWTAIENGRAVLVGFANGEPIIKMKPRARKESAPSGAKRSVGVPNNKHPRAKATAHPKPAQQKKVVATAPPHQSAAVAASGAGQAPRSTDEPPCPLDWGRLILPGIVPN